VWKGTGEWSVAQHVPALQRRLEGRRSVVFPGLRPAHYTLDIQVELTEIATGRVVDPSGMRGITVTEECLSPTYRIPNK
jgi:hypothetical protein